MLSNFPKSLKQLFSDKNIDNRKSVSIQGDSLQEARSMVEGAPNYTTCIRHNRPLEAFCFVDKQTLCLSCLLEKKHKDHEVEEIDKAFEKAKSILLARKGELFAREASFKACVARGESDLTGCLAESFVLACRKVKLGFKELKSVISRRKSELLSDLE